MSLASRGRASRGHVGGQRRASLLANGGGGPGASLISGGLGGIAESDDEGDEKKFTANPKHLDGIPDMSSLIYMEGPNVLHNLSVRYGKKEIYTNIVAILLAVNPYENLDCYSGDVIEEYRAQASSRKKLPPHVFSVSAAALYNMKKYKMNQSMVVCGESGSGKTESAKQLMRYLAFNNSPSQDDTDVKKASIEKQVLDCNPILESFGNAKTVLNNNSSRFGKFTKLVFTREFQIAGSLIETYLLEKSRVVKQTLGERNYHIFYLLFQDSKWKSQFELTEPADFWYLRQSETYEAPGIKDSEWLDELVEALGSLDNDEETITQLFGIVAGILHLGNIEFVDDKNEVATCSDDSKHHLTAAAKCLQVDEQALLTRCTTLTLKIRAQEIKKTLNTEAAKINRDAMSMAIYQATFNWIRIMVNQQLYDAKARNPELNWVGILDVFGFENFDNNSFEQFCINFCNERLQEFFNTYIIKSEQDEYLVEGIGWVEIEVPDSKDVIELFEKSNNGILAILDSACKQPKGDSMVFLKNLFTMRRYHKRMRQVKNIKIDNENVEFHGFSITHYAAKVTYNADQFVEKNTDTKPEETIKLLATSTNVLATKVFDDPDEKEEKGKKGPSTSFRSLGTSFIKQLRSLMTLLQSTTPYFVRCIKPNSVKKPKLFDWDYVRPQLECGGIIEALRILKLGYPTRCSYDDIFERYGSILSPCPPNLNKRDFCEAVLRCCNGGLQRSEFQLGLSKVFFRPGKQEFLEQLLESKDLMTSETIIKIQQFLLNKRFQRARGTIYAHIAFSVKLKKWRAVKQARRSIRASKVMAHVLVGRLAKIRAQTAAQSLQAHIRAENGLRQLAAQRKAANQLGSFFMNAKLTGTINKVLKSKIEKRRKENEAAAAALKKQAEAERRERMKREAEERKAAQKAAREEQARIAAEKKAKQEEERRLAEEERQRKKEEAEAERARQAEERRLKKEAEDAARSEAERIRREEAEEKRRIAAEERAEREAERQRAALAAEQQAAREMELRKIEAETRRAELEMQKQSHDTALELQKTELENRERLLEEEAEHHKVLITSLEEREQEVLRKEELIEAVKIQQEELAKKLRFMERDNIMEALAQKHKGFGVKITNDEGEVEEEYKAVYISGEQDEELGAVLAWREDHDEEEPTGTLVLADVALVKGGKPGDKDKIAAKSKYLYLESEDGSLCLLKAPSSKHKKTFVLHLSYAVRNAKEFGTITRPVGDTARGHELCNELMCENERLKNGGAPAAVASNDAQADADGGGSDSDDDTKTSQPAQPKPEKSDAEEVTRLRALLGQERLFKKKLQQLVAQQGDKASELREQLIAFEQQNMDEIGKELKVDTERNERLKEMGEGIASMRAQTKRLTILGGQKGRMQRASIIQAGTSVLVKEKAQTEMWKKKYTQMMAQYQAMERENLDLKLQVKKLLSQRDKFLAQQDQGLSALLGGGNAAKQIALEEKKETAQAAAQKVAKLAQEVKKTESNVKAKQDSMKAAMKVLQDKEAEIKSTVQMLNMLGVDPDDLSSADENDATQQKLVSLYTKQKTASAAAKKELEGHYAEMVRAAEALSAKNEVLKKEVETKTALESEVVEDEKAAEDDGCVIM